MRHIAKALAAQGRGPDTELLHVSRNELKHLAGLAGLRELPRNPKTGLPEAGLFESILPIVGGVAGGALGGPWGAALGSGLGTKLAGGSDTDALRSGALSGIGSTLMEGLSNAPTAAPVVDGTPISAASLTNPVADAASATPNVSPLMQPSASGIGSLDPTTQAAFNAPAPATELTAAGADAYATPQSQMLAQQTAGMDTSGWGGAGNAPAAKTGLMDRALNWAGEHPMQAGILGLTAVNALSQPTTPAQQKHLVEMKGQARSNRTYTGGVPAAGANPYAERNYFSNNNPYSYTQAPSTYEMRYAEGGQVRGYAEGGTTQPQGYIHPQYASVYQPGLNTQVAPGTVSPAMQAAFQQPAAQTGIGSLPSTGAQPGGINYSDPNWYANAAAQSMAANPLADGQYDSAAGQFLRGHTGPGSGSTSMGALGRVGLAPFTGGLSLTPGGSDFIGNTLGSVGLGGFFAKGGKLNLRAPSKKMDPIFLKGAGDGMSDSIPAYIDGGGVRPHEPIRVADSEYVVPADAVSHLGNGSSDAGAKQLDAMVARVRKARTGKKAQAPAVNAKKILPA